MKVKKKYKNGNSNLSLEEVNHMAKLANLELTEKELEKFREQLSETVSYIHDLEEIDTKHIKPTSQVTGKKNQFREDEIVPSLPQAKALKNGKSHNGFFVAKISWN